MSLTRRTFVSSSAAAVAAELFAAPADSRKPNSALEKLGDAALREAKKLKASYCDVTDSSSFPRSSGGFDTVICLNVVEHVEDDVRAMENIRSVLSDGGAAIVLVPNGPWNFGTLDEVLGHHRRYTKESLRKLSEDSGFVVEELIEFNRIGTPAWYLNGKILRRRVFGLFQIWMLNLLTPVFRVVDSVLPFPPLSLIVILRKGGITAADTVDDSNVRPAVTA